MTHVTCRSTAKNRDQLRNPTLGNRVWATFTSACVYCSCCVATTSSQCRGATSSASAASSSSLAGERAQAPDRGLDQCWRHSSTRLSVDASRPRSAAAAAAGAVSASQRSAAAHYTTRSPTHRSEQPQDPVRPLSPSPSPFVIITQLEG